MNEPTGIPAFDLPRATALLTAIADGADAARENRQSFEVSPNVTAELRSIAARLLSGEQDRERIAKLEESASAGWECIEMAQEQLRALIYLSRMEKGAAAMFLPEAIRNACILTRDEALARQENEIRASLRVVPAPSPAEPPDPHPEDAELAARSSEGSTTT